MASKFFQKPQLGQAQLSEAAQSNLPDTDRVAEMKAQKAAANIDKLTQLGQKAVQTVVGGYLDNIDAKHRLESGRQHKFFLDHVKDSMVSTEDFDSLSNDALQAKYIEYTETFMEQHKDKPYADTLRKDLVKMNKDVLGNMISTRGQMSSQIVADATAEGASNAAQMYAEGLIDIDQLKGRLSQLDFDATLGFQDPASSSLPLSEKARENYRAKITSVQSKEAILRGMMVQTGKPANSLIAELLDDKDFRKEMGVGDTNEDYNKLVQIAYEKGARADKVTYETGLDSLKETLYNKTNQGFSVNIETELELFKTNKGEITAQDEARLRKTFEKVNEVNNSASMYVGNLMQGKDISAGLTQKNREEIYERSFSNVLGLNDTDFTIDSVSAQLSSKEGQVGFSDYLKAGGKIPKKFQKMFDVPAGSSADKWNRASAAVVSMQAAATGSGQSVEEVIGVKQISKIRGMARILNNDDMEASVKESAIAALQTHSTTFNSKGYLKGDPDRPVDVEWLNSVSTDAPWTTDDYVSSAQNADEIAGNYNAYILAGNSPEDAQELAVDLFNKTNASIELSDGSEIAVPLKHKYLNNVSIDEFSKSTVRNASGELVPRFPSIHQQRRDLEISTGKGFISEWRARTNISFRKAYNYGKTGKYDMLYNGRIVDNASFSYEELENFISDSPAKLRNKMTKEEHRSFKQVEEDALNVRRESIERRSKDKTPDEERIRNLYDLTI